MIAYCLEETISLLISLLDDDLRASKSTGSSGGDQTDLLTRDSEARHSSGMTNVLMVTTTVRVIDGVHCDTSNLGPAVALDSVLVELVTSLQDGLVNTTATGDQTDDSAAL